MGRDAAAAVEGVLTSFSKPSEGIVATLVGAVFLLIGATSVFGEWQDALDRIWRAPVRAKAGGVWGLVRARLLSFGMIFGLAFLLMVSLILSAGMAALGKTLIGLYIGKTGVASGFGAAGSLVVLLVWVYFSAQIFFTGAEFTWVYARTCGSMKGQVLERGDLLLSAPKKQATQQAS